MTPQPLAPIDPQRLNAWAAHAVRVEKAVSGAALAAFWLGSDWASEQRPPSEYTRGTLNADGSLTLAPERWAIRHYRRFVMRGAGVYRWGLWATFGGARPAKAGAALNGAAQLGSFAPFGYEPPPLEGYTLGDFLQAQIRHVVKVAQRKAFQGKERVSLFEAERLFSGLKEKIAEAINGVLKSLGLEHLDAAFSKTILHKIEESFRQLNPYYKNKRLSWHFWAVLRKIVQKSLARLARVVKPRRPQTRAPRPLYARPRPPAAPLAPPYLA